MVGTAQMRLLPTLRSQFQAASWASTTSRSRRRFARGLTLNFQPSHNRGRGECRVPNAPAASCALWGSEYAHEYSQRRHRKHPAFPTQWFYGLYVISPGTGLFCPRHFRGIVSRENLAPASGRQDHTTSPSAAAPLVLRRIRVHRIPPRVRDDAYAPLVEAGRRGEYTISDFRKVKYLCVQNRQPKSN